MNLYKLQSKILLFNFAMYFVQKPFKILAKQVQYRLKQQQSTLEPPEPQLAQFPQQYPVTVGSISKVGTRKSLSHEKFNIKKNIQVRLFPIYGQSDYFDKKLKKGVNDDFQQGIRSKHNNIVRIIQTHISDFVVLETNLDESNQYKQLNENDWQNIINTQSINGYNVADIQFSIITQKLHFKERRKLWELFANLNEIKSRRIDYDKLKSKQCKYKDQILKDVTRTYNSSSFFKNEDNSQSLSQVLIAYANFDTELGYTQGMNIIAANLILCCDLMANDDSLEDIEVLDSERDKTAFYLMIHIMIDKKWGTLFLDGFPGLIQKVGKFDQLFQKEIPDLREHFKQQGIVRGSLIYFVQQDCIPLFQQYYFTLLMYDMSMAFSRTILDLFLFLGEDFIHIFILAMLKYYKETLLKYQFEDIFSYCKHQMLKDFVEVFNEIQNSGKLIATLERIGLVEINIMVDQIQEKRKLSLGEKLKLYLLKE